MNAKEARAIVEPAIKALHAGGVTAVIVALTDDGIAVTNNCPDGIAVALLGVAYEAARSRAEPVAHRRPTTTRRRRPN